MGDWSSPSTLRGNAGTQSELIQQIAEGIAVIGFVGQNRSPTLEAIDQIGSQPNVVAMSG